MAPKTLREREKELQTLFATAEGREQLRALETQYQAAGGRVRATRASVITYLIVYERERGLIVG